MNAPKRTAIMRQNAIEVHSCWIIWALFYFTPSTWNVILLPRPLSITLMSIKYEATVTNGNNNLLTFILPDEEDKIIFFCGFASDLF